MYSSVNRKWVWFDGCGSASPQVVKNACATQAILSVLLNASHSDLELGTVLSEFKEFTNTLDPAVRLISRSHPQEMDY